MSLEDALADILQQEWGGGDGAHELHDQWCADDENALDERDVRKQEAQTLDEVEKTTNVADFVLKPARSRQ